MTSDQWAIIGIGGPWAVMAGVLGLAAAHAVRHRTFRWQIGVVAVTNDQAHLTAPLDETTL